MKTLKTFLLVLLVAAGADVSAAPRSPFGVAASVTSAGDAKVLRVNFTVPAECVLYAERLHFEKADGSDFAIAAMPAPTVVTDSATGHEKKTYQSAFAVDLKLDAPLPLELAVKFQGCSNGACFFPEKRTFTVAADGTAQENIAPKPAETPAAAPGPNDENNETAVAEAGWRAEADGFKILGAQSGYLKTREFISFLNSARSGGVSDNPLGRFKDAGVLLTVLLILVGGAGLNLTPCVLPLIPINLAIIGAGKAAHTRSAGFLHGAAYGLGMSLAYGILGLVVVKTGAKFGTLNSSIWFNVVIAVVFAVLALAMFDVFHIDFGKFDRGLGRQESHAAHGTKSKWLVAFTLGAIAALLAGACVAPVVISVLLLAANFYAQGNVLGLALPFLLGVGMALPWPFMGASLSFLPKPGRWMVRVKQVFGVLILIFAGYYGWIAFGLIQSPPASAADGKGSNNAELVLAQALQVARETKKPVFIDFKASWCKNCEAMDATVFNQPAVKKSLKDFVVVRYPAERPNESPAREVMDRFKVMGLPTYVILSPN